MVDPQIIKEWLQKAEDDFEFACSVIEDSPFYAQICFHFHQAAEKYLKALIIAYDLEFKKIHDLPVLLKSCLEIGPGLETLMDDCTFLNGFYIDARYPVHWPTEYTNETALKAKGAVDQIRSRIAPLIRPYQKPVAPLSESDSGPALRDRQQSKAALSAKSASKTKVN
jgi:HEPN domain-containing protein